MTTPDTPAALKLPKLQCATLVLPKGHERKVYVGQAFLGGAMQDATTAAGFSWDDAGLVAVVECADAEIVAVQGGGRDNPESWKDDGVELLLDPGHRHGEPVLIRVSAAGALWDSLGSDAAYDIEGLRAHVVRIDGGWRATIAIPWPGLGVAAPADGEIWGLNIRRIDHPGAFSLMGMADGSWTPMATEAQDVLHSGHIAFMLPESLEDDAKLAAMRQALADGHDAAVRQWAGPNDGDVLVLGSQPLTIPRLGRIASGAPARQATTVALSRDDEALVVDFDCEDADIVAEQEGRDSVKLWKDDSVYVWLDPGHTHDEQAMIMVQVSAAGAVTDSKGGDAAWDLEGLVADVKRTDKGWRARLRIPFAGLGVAAPALTPNASPLTPAATPAAVWGVNFVRMDQPGCYDYQRMQMTSFAVVPGGDPAAIHRWGHLAFGDAPDPAQTPAHAAMKQTVEERLGADAAAEAAEQERLAAYRGVPTNPEATEDVRKIVKWFGNLHQRSEKRLVLAQDIWCYDTIDGKTGMDAGYMRFAESIYKKSGKWLPMIHVSFGDPSNPKQGASVAEQAIKHGIDYWKAGGLVHIHINPCSPLSGEPYSGPNALDGRERIAEVLESGSEANQRWMKILDGYAACLAELRDAGVVALWRPLHEMGFEACYWYDWGALRSGEVFTEIWRHMVKYFNEEKKLDNLVWVWGGGGVHSLDMYPGSEYVDMVGFSYYGSDLTGGVGEYREMLRYNKPIAFTEFGPAGAEEPAFDNLDLVRAVREQYPMMTSATYWHSWTGVRTAIADCRNVEALMNHPWVIDRDSLDWRDVEVGEALGVRG